MSGRMIAEDAGPGSDVMLARDPMSHAPLKALKDGRFRPRHAS